MRLLWSGANRWTQQTADTELWSSVESVTLPCPQAARVLWQKAPRYLRYLRAMPFVFKNMPPDVYIYENETITESRADTAKQ